MAIIYLDEDMSRKLVPLLSASGHIVHTAQDEGRKSAGDDEQFLYAVRQAWVLVTHNRDDFRLLHDAWLRWGCQPTHAGILTMSHAPLPVLAAAIIEFFDTHSTIAGNLWEWWDADGWDPDPRELRWAVSPNSI
jgi:predicted nuclease of predicted toxin-antitoxin system